MTQAPGNGSTGRTNRSSELQRWAVEPDLATPWQFDPLVTDRTRVLTSTALRALGGKTQSLDPHETHVPRTRLTHSLEVADLGRRLGAWLGADPVLLDIAGLAHDLGHPPFGHHGEAVLNDLAAAAGGFEANAQTFRLLTRLEPGGSVEGGGLNLTRAALDTTCKYPWPRRAGQQKFGVYSDDLPAFEWVRAGAPGERPCMEAQIMDWADDIANAVADLEDGIRSGLIPLAVLTDRQHRTMIADLAAEKITTQPAAAVLEAADGLMNSPFMAELVRSHDDSPTTARVASRTAHQLHDRFLGAAVATTYDHSGLRPMPRYTGDLIVSDHTRGEVAWLHAVVLHHVHRDPARRARRTRQTELLTELAAALLAAAPQALEPISAAAWNTATTEPERIRAVVDHLASLTEAEAITAHQTLARRETARPARL
ncbi:deoxyguanosinetriphosphate triphosphohydrolase [Cryptosporangium sp. NPDC048952]|uniref:deoxyguanosinetriphosphate triphosphohydrolase n=1 Tax=Cryptosporangium sp. NPDC048952 TaxID=3363961 RepID=UPI00371CA1FA